jgi:hypothetical protein
MGGMPDELYLPSGLRLSSLLLTGWVRKIMKQKSRKIIRLFTNHQKRTTRQATPSDPVYYPLPTLPNVFYGS